MDDKQPMFYDLNYSIFPVKCLKEGIKNRNSVLNRVGKSAIFVLYRDLLAALPMCEPSIFRGIAVSLLRPVIGSNVEIDVVALNWVADVRKQIAGAFK